jgi:Ca2+-binding EF-hand superfamily protein
MPTRRVLTSHTLYILIVNEIDPTEHYTEDTIMKKQSVTGIALLVVAMTAVPVLAADSHGKGRFMAFFDTNNDGMVNMAEFTAAVEQRFKLTDTDANGFVSKEEFRAYLGARKEERQKKKFARMDSNANGTVERSEYLAYQQARAERQFARIDKDGNGAVSKDEYESGRKHRHHKRNMFERMDTDKDGQISKNESLTAWSNWFKRIDANNDQVVTTDEVKAYKNQIHGKSNGSK